MSVYTRCSEAIASLAVTPDVFTEIDVVDRAATDAWADAEFKDALRYAGQILSAQYRNGQLLRFGPIGIEDGSDYARWDGSIVYAGAEVGPSHWETPNGGIPALIRHEDGIHRTGRRRGGWRADNQLWTEQGIVAMVAPIDLERAPSASQDIGRLTRLLTQRDKRIAKLEAEITRLKDRLDRSDVLTTRGEVEDLVRNLAQEAA